MRGGFVHSVKLSLKNNSLSLSLSLCIIITQNTPCLYAFSLSTLGQNGQNGQNGVRAGILSKVSGILSRGFWTEWGPARAPMSVIPNHTAPSEPT